MTRKKKSPEVTPMGHLSSFGPASIESVAQGRWIVEQALRWEFAETADAIEFVARLTAMARSTAYYRVSLIIEPEREIGEGVSV